MEKKAQKQAKGNVLFIILVAIALFAALSFTLVNMGRNSSSLSREDAMISADQILDFSTVVQEAVERMIYSGSAAVQGVSFENSQVGAPYAHSPLATAEEKVFDRAGGGVTYLVPRAKWLDGVNISETAYGQWFFPDATCVPNVGKGDTDGTACSADSVSNEELIIALPYVAKDVCLTINDKLGVDNPSGNPPLDTGCAFDPATDHFQGVFNEGKNISAAQLNGKSAACFTVDTGCPAFGGGEVYVFYRVLAPR
jgi:hypothetical protein